MCADCVKMLEAKGISPKWIKTPTCDQVRMELARQALKKAK